MEHYANLYDKAQKRIDAVNKAMKYTIIAGVILIAAITAYGALSRAGFIKNNHLRFLTSIPVTYWGSEDSLYTLYSEDKNVYYVSAYSKDTALVIRIPKIGKTADEALSALYPGYCEASSTSPFTILAAKEKLITKKGEELPFYSVSENGKDAYTEKDSAPAAPYLQALLPLPFAIIFILSIIYGICKEKQIKYDAILMYIREHPELENDRENLPRFRLYSHPVGALTSIFLSRGHVSASRYHVKYLPPKKKKKTVRS